MAKREPLKAKRTALETAAQAKDNPSDVSEIRTTGISLPKWAWELLADVALARKKARGGRASVSAILLELVAKNRAELESELKP